VSRADVPRVAEILGEPEVARWFGTGEPAEIAEELATAGDAAVFAVDVAGEVIGVVQYYEEDDPEYRHAGLDIFLTAVQHGRGLGPEALRLLARHLFEDRGHHRLVIDPAADNARAIRAYERVGFRPVGIMRQYELGRDGTWHDGLLMDLLATEFRP
jgi:aminoglycoside 6'-N-acetyltransferase